MGLKKINTPFFTLETWNQIQDLLTCFEKDLVKEDLDVLIRKEIQKKYSYFNELLSLYNEWVSTEKEIDQLKIEKNKADSDLKELIEEELIELNSSSSSLYSKLENNIYISDIQDDRSVFLEIRAGTGGLEASLFAADLAKMYSMYALRKGWIATITDMAQTDLGGIRDITLHIEGKRVYESLKHEAGVHRVQRVPTTEGSGRIHTSTASIAILPEVDEVEIDINPADLKIDTYRASGAGGQHVNKTDSAVRITHLPTGTVVCCQEERSQHKNKARALKALKSRIFAAEKEKRDKDISKMRKEMSGSADRSDKVRTYNFPQNRVSDHQVNLTLNKLEYILNGDLEELVEALIELGRKNRTLHPQLKDIVKKE